MYQPIGGYVACMATREPPETAPAERSHYKVSREMLGDERKERIVCECGTVVQLTPEEIQQNPRWTCIGCGRKMRVNAADYGLHSDGADDIRRGG
jgi:hypothetical protein